MSKDVEDCTRHRVTMKDGTNFYFIMGKDFIQCTPPFENRPENLKTRVLLDSFCDAVSEAMRRGNND